MKRFVQFIAGAICPSCKEKDTIALNTNNDEIYCIKCDFKDKRPSEEGLKNTKEINVVNLHDFKKSKNKN